MAKTNNTIVDNSVMAVGLGVEVVGAVNFWPDTRCSDGAVLGVMKRIATKMPEIDEKLFDEFEDFSRCFIVTYMSSCVIPPDQDLSVETWLDGTNYTAGRKKELLQCYYDHVALAKKDFDVNCHIKYESYKEAKHFRGIYSRSDYFKCYFGPICAVIGKMFFNLPWFVKYLSSSEKRDRLVELFDNDFVRIFSNDFTSFEATFGARMMRIEVFFFEFCLCHVPNRDEIMRNIRKTKMGVNRLIFKMFMCWLQSKRYSGEMDTSLCNSLLNLLFVCFMLHKSGHDSSFYVSKFPPQIEGDDCLGAFIHPLDDDILLRLGAKAKIEYFDTFNEASFCGMVFSSESKCIIRDPISAILDFGFVNYQYINASLRLRMKLIRAKALSLIHSYPGCPVLRSLAFYGLRITNSVDDKHAVYAVLKGEKSVYRRHYYETLFSIDKQALLDVTIDMSSRLLMESKFGLSVSDQLALELYLDGLTVMQNLDHPAILANCGYARQNHYYNFVCDKPNFNLKGKPPQKILNIYKHMSVEDSGDNEKL
jgi:hypothetical protein